METNTTDAQDAPVPNTSDNTIAATSATVNALLNGIVNLTQTLADRDTSRDQQLTALLQFIRESKADNDVPKPDHYQGHMKQTTTFLFQINTAINSNPQRYDTVQKKIRFMSSRFKDTALM
ncbi:unnamed protein product, partial [Tilletia caries]